jgi:[ribosomal protein S5]-alanine N-acetyltransferase
MFAVLVDPAIYAYENSPPASIEWLRARFVRLESRRSADGREHWLNWVLRTADDQLIGYVQATVYGDGSAALAYVLGSAYWGRGLASQAVAALIDELVTHYQVRTVFAVLKRENRRSLGLLRRLGFTAAPPALRAAHPVESDEWLMWRPVAGA